MAQKFSLKFTEFASMEKSIDGFYLTDEAKKAEWIVTEKVHGSNFSFHVSSTMVKAASRRRFLKPNEDFFAYKSANFMKTKPIHIEKMKGVYKSVTERYPAEPKIFQVSIWGELYGGTYIVDGENLNKLKMNPVQREIEYSPRIEWVAYDISYRTEKDKFEQDFVDYDVAMEIFKQHDVSHLEPLLKGNMLEVLSYDLEFDSLVPKVLGQPELPFGTNIAEGVVARPLKTLRCINKKENKEARLIIKIKHPTYDESREPPGKRQSTGNGDNVPHKKITKKASVPELVKKVLEYCTEKRLKSAVSKYGYPVGQERVGDVVDELVKSIWTDFSDDINQEISKVSDTELMGEIRFAIRTKATELATKMESESESDSESNSTTISVVHEGAESADGLREGSLVLDLEHTL